ncbi:MAG: porin [Methylococcaceae bacterium]|nr:porin [Methylococcaceae bacterium]
MAVYMALSSPCTAFAAESASGLYEELTGSRLSELPGLGKLGLSLGGWISAGITYNHHDPGNHSNGTVTFNDRSSEFQLNQFYLYLERVVNKESKRWDIGGRVDFLWGTDSRFTQTAGHWDSQLISASESRFYDIALPQAYVEITTPYIRGATVKIGHFYTLLGQEVVPSPNNFFYSHAYAMQYGEPFTHTGVLFSLPAGTSFTVNLGAVTGPHGIADNFDRHPGNGNFLGGVNWLSENGGTSVAAALTSGDTDARGSPNRTIASLVVSHDFTDKLHYIIQFDHGSQERPDAKGGGAQWYGLNQYLTYALTDSVVAGLRAEWFRDQNGVRVASFPASYYETTLGLNWKPKPWLLLRTEARYDWSDGTGRIFDVGTQSSQLTLGANAAVSF